ncbi:MAG: DUF2934 domain-containing protein [Kaiparowitsia implicata GSE-PSE-MK54-09C]|nr:DUF2934 domain-containing protein [Kaiparowitsia implicata GSE-PSE-MK54-09C]
MNDREQEVRGIAYDLWQAEGRPGGQANDHWRRAEEIWADADGPAPRLSSEPFGEPVEPVLAVADQGIPPELDDKTDRTVAPRRQRRRER